MDEKRKAELDLVLRDIDKNIGKGIIKYGNDVGPKKQLPTGIKQIDDFLGGGWTIGNFSVVYGVESCGKSTLALQTVAHAQKLDKICCYVDLEHSLDEVRATELGVIWKDLVVIDTAENAEQAMDAIIKLARGKVVDFVVVDSIQAFVPKGDLETKKGKEKSIADDTIAQLARKLSDFFKRVSTPIFKADISVLMIGQVRTQGIGTFFIRDGLSGGKALLHWAYNTIYVRRGQNADAPMYARKELFLDPAGKLHKVTKKDPAGFDAVLKMEKTKASGSAPEKTEIHVPFYLECGFSELRIQEEIPEVITGTEEEQEKIREMIVDKSTKIDYSKEAIKLNKEKFKGKTIDVMSEPIINKVVLEDEVGNKKTIIDDVMPEEPNPIELKKLKEGSMAPVKRKRGRPAKSKKKEKK